MGSGPKGKGKERDKEPRERKKPGRIPTSCAECRRLKLKCDKSVPCSKCVQRGCGSICPDGALAPGKGNRLVLANTEELHDRIDQMAARNRELESALRAMHESHPLLQTSGFNLQQGSSSNSTSSSSKSPASTSRVSPTHLEEDERLIIDSFGTMTLGRQGDSHYFGKTSRPEYLIHAPNKSRGATQPTLPHIPQAVMEVAFPESVQRDDHVITEILNLLPERAEAFHLCGVYMEHGKFLYNPIPRDELLNEVLAVVYRNEGIGTSDHFHAMALLFIVFAIGTLFDPNKEPYATEAHEYYYLAQSTLNLSQPFRETTLATIHTFIHMAHYLELTDSDAVGPDSAWIHIGHAVRLSFSIGLHLDGRRWRIHEDLVRRRNDLFWRLFVADTLTSLHLGRPTSISTRHIDCSYPRGVDDTPTSSEFPADLNFHSWHTQFTLLLHTVMENALGSRQPVYSAIIEFDKKIRDFHVPLPWRMSHEDDSTPPTHDVAMSRWLVLSVKEIALLSLHRSYMGAALQEAPTELHRHRYLPSVVATFRSSWRLIRGLATTWMAVPKLLSRVNLAWSHGLSAAIVMSMLVTRAPTSHLTAPAFEELDNVASLFDSAASSCRSAAKLLPTLQALQRKTHEVIGPPHSRSYSHYDDSTMSVLPVELDRLNGKTHLFSDHPLSMSTPTTSTMTTDDRSRATSVTMSDAAEHQHHLRPASSSSSTHFHAASADNNAIMHATLAQDLREYVARSSVPSIHSMSFYDHPSDPSSMALPPSSSSSIPHPHPPHSSSFPHPPHIQAPPPPRVQTQPFQPHQPYTHHHPQHPHHPQQHYYQHPTPSLYQTAARETPFEQTKFLLLQPAQQHLPQQMHIHDVSSPPVTGGFGTGFQPGFVPYGGPIALDSSWGSFVEQLGF